MGVSVQGHPYVLACPMREIVTVGVHRKAEIQTKPFAQHPAHLVQSTTAMGCATFLIMVIRKKQSILSCWVEYFSRLVHFHAGDRGPNPFGDAKLIQRVTTVYLMNTEYQEKRCKAVLLRKETKRKGSGQISVKWILQDIYLEDTQHNKL